MRYRLVIFYEKIQSIFALLCPIWRRIPDLELDAICQTQLCQKSNVFDIFWKSFDYNSRTTWDIYLLILTKHTSFKHVFLLMSSKLKPRHNHAKITSWRQKLILRRQRRPSQRQFWQCTSLILKFFESRSDVYPCRTDSPQLE